MTTNGLKSLAKRAFWHLGYSVSRRPTIAKTLSEAVASYRRDGFVVVRGALPRDWISAYRTRVEAWFDDIDRRIQAGERNDSLDIYARQSGINIGPSRDADMRAPYELRDFLEQLRRSGLWDAGFFDEPLGALIEACSIRRQKPDEANRALGYHQDSAVIGSEDGLVFWIPLTPIDAVTPTLEIIPHWGRPLVHVCNPHNGYLETTEEIEGTRIALTRAEPGDVLVFPLATPHRTILTPGMTQTRFSIDLRAVPVSRVPTGYKGWVVMPRGG